MRRLVLAAILASAVLLSAGDAFCRNCTTYCSTIGTQTFCNTYCY